VADQSMSATDFRSLYELLRRGNPWGSEDRRGALNALTPARVAAAASAVRTGRTVSLAAPVENEASADNPDPWVHEVSHPGTGQDGAPGLDFATDTLSLHVHGNVDSHIDALCHVVYDGTLYNDVSLAAGRLRRRGSCLSTPPARASPAVASCSTSRGCAAVTGWSRAST
jgi:hypothetical protein